MRFKADFPVVQIAYDDGRRPRRSGERPVAHRGRVRRGRRARVIDTVHVVPERRRLARMLDVDEHRALVRRHDDADNFAGSPASRNISHSNDMSSLASLNRMMWPYGPAAHHGSRTWARAWMDSSRPAWRSAGMARCRPLSTSQLAATLASWWASTGHSGSITQTVFRELGDIARAARSRSGRCSLVSRDCARHLSPSLPPFFSTAPTFHGVSTKNGAQRV